MLLFFDRASNNFSICFPYIPFQLKSNFLSLLVGSLIILHRLFKPSFPKFYLGIMRVWSVVFFISRVLSSGSIDLTLCLQPTSAKWVNGYDAGILLRIRFSKDLRVFIPNSLLMPYVIFYKLLCCFSFSTIASRMSANCLSVMLLLAKQISLMSFFMYLNVFESAEVWSKVIVWFRSAYRSGLNQSWIMIDDTGMAFEFLWHSLTNSEFNSPVSLWYELLNTLSSLKRY